MRRNCRFAKNNNTTFKIIEKEGMVKNKKYWKPNPSCSEEHRRLYKKVFYEKKLEGENVGEKE